MLARTRGELRERKACALGGICSENIPNISCVIGCNININRLFGVGFVSPVTYCGICRGDEATGGPLEAGSLKISQTSIHNDTLIHTCIQTNRQKDRYTNIHYVQTYLHVHIHTNTHKLTYNCPF